MVNVLWTTMGWMVAVTLVAAPCAIGLLTLAALVIGPTTEQDENEEHIRQAQQMAEDLAGNEARATGHGL